MICIKDYEHDLQRLGSDYFISDIRYVPDIMEWAKENNENLGEPYNPMKLIVAQGNALTMVMQAEIPDEFIDNVIKNLSIRWSVQDNITNIDEKLNGTKKRLVFCFLKERARTMKDVEGNELVEDRWVFDEMETLGFFGNEEETI